MVIRDIRDLPFGRETYFKLPDRPAFTVERSRIDCGVCYERGEEPEVAEWNIAHDGKEIEVCNAHMQEFLDSINNQLDKGASINEWFKEDK